MSLCVCICSFVLVCVYLCVNVTPTHIKNTQICPDTETHTWSNFRFTKVGPDVFLCACAYVCVCVCVFWCDTHRHMYYTRTTNIKTPRNTKTGTHTLTQRYSWSKKRPGPTSVADKRPCSLRKIALSSQPEPIGRQNMSTNPLKIKQKLMASIHRIRIIITCLI